MFLWNATWYNDIHHRPMVQQMVSKNTWYRYLRPHYCFIVNSYCLILLPIAAVFWSDCQDKDVIWPHQIFQDQKHFLEIVHGKLTAAIIKSLFRISCSQLLSTRHRAGALSVPVLLFVGYSRLIHAWFYVIIVVGKKSAASVAPGIFIPTLFTNYRFGWPLYPWMIIFSDVTMLSCWTSRCQSGKATAYIVSPSYDCC